MKSSAEKIQLVIKSYDLSNEEKMSFFNRNLCISCKINKEYGQDDSYFCERCEDIHFIHCKKQGKS